MAGIAGCPSYLFEQKLPQKVREMQVSRGAAMAPPADILLVIDDSGSMTEEMTQIKTNVNTFASKIGGVGLDYVVIFIVKKGTSGNTICVPPPLAGACYGLAVWAGSYLGLLPALGVLKPATEHPVRRIALMIAAHLVWGAALGATVPVIEEEGS